MKFDIIIPTCGRDASLSKAVESAIPQLNEHGRIIVVNDGELDVARILEQQFAEQVSDERLIVISNSGPHGASRARNAGVAFSNAELILFLDDDDTFAPQAVERILAAAKGDFKYGFAVSPKKAQTGQRGARIADLPVKYRFAATSAAFWIRRDVFNAIGQFDEELTVAEDFDLCARLRAKQIAGWASYEAGVKRGQIRDTDQTQSLVQRTAVKETIRCRHELMARNLDNFSYANAEKFYLIEQFARRAVRSGMSRYALKKIAKQFPNPIALFGLIVWVFNLLGAPRDAAARK